MRVQAVKGANLFLQYIVKLERKQVFFIRAFSYIVAGSACFARLNL
jgi:hypothetical protein